MVFLFCFMGQIPHTGKRDSFNRNLTKLVEQYEDKYKFFIEITDGFASGFTHDKYLSILGNSRLSLCPQGAISDETFRFFESILMGAIPLVEHLPKLWYYECAPHLKTRSWNELEKSIAQSLNFMQTPKCRDLFYNVSDYTTQVLDPSKLALLLKKAITDRLQTRSQDEQQIIALRKILKDEDMESDQL